MGPFQATVQIGQDIHIQTALAGLMFSSCKPLTINWTGGDPNALVTGSIVQQFNGVQGINVYSQVRASAGTLTISGIPSNSCMLGPTPVVVRVEVDPDPSEISPFSASGLSLGGQATWQYVHNFQAVWGVN